MRDDILLLTNNINNITNNNDISLVIPKLALRGSLFKNYTPLKLVFYKKQHLRGTFFHIQAITIKRYRRYGT